MSRHYSESEFINWVRKKIFKINKPEALLWGQWDVWDNDTRTNRPVGYFFTETLPDWVESIPEHSVDYIHKIRIKVENRKNNSHCLGSSLEKGVYYEFSNRMIYSLFDSFVDFVECELSVSHIRWGDPEKIEKYNIPWWRKFRLLEWGKHWRCKQAAIDHLKWEMTLTGNDRQQAINAQEVMSLYVWWTEIRPSRKDSWEESGLREFWDKMSEKYSEGENLRGDWLGLGGKTKMNTSEEAKYRQLSNEKDKIEEQWNQEDEDMMIRLIKIRRNLWT